MTTLELKVNLSDRVNDAMRRHVAQTLLAGVARATAIGGKPLSMDEIQAEVDAVRKAHRGKRQVVEKRQVMQLLDTFIGRGHLEHQVEESHAQGVALIPQCPQCPRRTP
ncbi:MAG: hypothetical protein ABIK82_00940 [Pseudomonadota bacterium]